MPEGPEIKRAADRLSAALAGEELTGVQLNHDAVRPYDNLISGARVEQVYSRSKAMLIEFSTGITLYSHNQLYGVWRVNRLTTAPLASRKLRIELRTPSHAVRLYSATDISIWDSDRIEEHPYLQKLGPDVLDENFSASMLVSRLKDKRFSRRSLASLYLDQGFVAGIGNYLRSEILFTSGCNPSLKPENLDERQRRKLARETLKISRRSYETGGVTNLSSQAKKLKREGSEFERYRFYVFDREGRQCYECGDTIIREEKSSRRIYWCPICQACT